MIPFRTFCLPPLSFYRYIVGVNDNFLICVLSQCEMWWLIVLVALWRPTWKWSRWMFWCYQWWHQNIHLDHFQVQQETTFWMVTYHSKSSFLLTVSSLVKGRKYVNFIPIFSYCKLFDQFASTNIGFVYLQHPPALLLLLYLRLFATLFPSTPGSTKPYSRETLFNTSRKFSHTAPQTTAKYIIYGGGKKRVSMAMVSTRHHEKWNKSIARNLFFTKKACK